MDKLTLRDYMTKEIIWHKQIVHIKVLDGDSNIIKESENTRLEFVLTNDPEDDYDGVVVDIDVEMGVPDYGGIEIPIIVMMVERTVGGDTNG